MTESLLTSSGLPVTVRRSQRARRMRLTVDAHGVATVVLPRRATLAQARVFVRDQSAWLDQHAQRGQRADVEMQQLLQPDLLGRPTRLLMRGDWVDLVWGPGSALRLPVNGTLQHLERRLREQARIEAAAVIERQAPRLIKHPKTLTIRDQATRWGSLSGRGTLSLSWRLVMAPPAVFDYVVNHELAHLREPNHSPAFWEEVERLMPRYEIHRRWLRREGDSLRRILPASAD